MGNIYQSKIKRLGRDLLKKHYDRFNNNFDENKETLSQLGVIFHSRKQRNRVAGYITRLLNPQFGISKKPILDQEESWKSLARRREDKEKMKKRKKRKRRPRSVLI